MNEEAADIKKRIIKANNTIQKLSHRELIEYIAYMEQGYDNLQQENVQLKIEKEQAIKSISHYVYERDVLKQQLKDKDEKISKVKEFITKYDLYSIETVESEETKNKTCVPKMVNQVTCFRQKRLIREILESNKED